MARERRPRAPIGLGPGGRKLWGNMHDTFSFEGEPQKLAVLERACRTIDRIDRRSDDGPTAVGQRLTHTEHPRPEGRGRLRCGALHASGPVPNRCLVIKRAHHTLVGQPVQREIEHEVLVIQDNGFTRVQSHALAKREADKRRHPPLVGLTHRGWQIRRVQSADHR